MPNLLAAFVPWIADQRRHDNRFWGVFCALLVLPFGAALHHAVFFRPTCMMNNFSMQDYTDVAGLQRWLMADPSLGWAIAMAFTTYHLGRRFDVLRRLAAPINLSFLPLSIWIWDIPFTHRVVCMTGHDGRIALADGMPMRTMYLYFLGAALTAVFWAVNFARNR